MIKLSEEGKLKAEIGWKLGLLHQMLSQTVNAKEKFLKDIKCDSNEHTNDEPAKRPYCGYRESLSVWKEE